MILPDIVTSGGSLNGGISGLERVICFLRKDFLSYKGALKSLKLKFHEA